MCRWSCIYSKFPFSIFQSKASECKNITEVYRSCLTPKRPSCDQLWHVWLGHEKYFRRCFQARTLSPLGMALVDNALLYSQTVERGGRSRRLVQSWDLQVCESDHLKSHWRHSLLEGRACASLADSMTFSSMPSSTVRSLLSWFRV